MKERTLIIVKPDAMQRGIADEIIGWFEGAGFKVVARYTTSLTRELAEEHYKEHKAKPFFAGLVKYITSYPVLIALMEAEDAINRARELIGPTDPAEAPAGTIRGNLRGDVLVNEDGIILNMIHASDSIDSAKREINLFFGKEAILER
ncbi:MAG: nucleoside-diphosphate kinase [bacterium]